MVTFRIGERAPSDKSTRRKHLDKAKSRVIPPGRYAFEMPLYKDPASSENLTSTPKTPPNSDSARTSAERKPRLRVTRLRTDGQWVSPRQHHDSTQEKLDISGTFTCGQNLSSDVRRLRRARRKQVIPAECSGAFDSPETAEQESKDEAPVRGQSSTAGLSAEEVSSQKEEEAHEKRAAEMQAECARRAEQFKTKGNDAMKAGEYEKAQELYSQGLETILDTASDHKQLASKLLSNRAAVYLQQSEVELALQDCHEARRIYPKNIRAYTRTATCYTVRGQLLEGLALLEKALEMLSASDPHFKSINKQIKNIYLLRSKYDEVTKRCEAGQIDGELVKLVEYLCEEMPRMERAWKLRALIYLQSRQFTKLRQVIKHVYDSDGMETINKCESQCWWHWMSMEALWWNPFATIQEILSSLSDLQSAIESASISRFETTPVTEQISATSIKTIVSQLNKALKCKESGNEAFSQKRYKEAIDHYSKAITICEESGAPMSFIAVLYSNRSAVRQGLGNYSEAMVDVCIAVSLNPQYTKAVFRFSQLCIATRDLASVQELLDQISSDGQKLSVQDQQTLQSLRDTIADKENQWIMVDAYKLLSLDRNCQATDVKKAFKKLALKLHPDKATHSVKLKLSWMKSNTQFVQEEETKTREKLHEYMNHLFKQLNTASNVLSDPVERERLDGSLEPNTTPRASYHSPRYDAGSRAEEFKPRRREKPRPGQGDDHPSLKRGFRCYSWVNGEYWTDGRDHYYYDCCFNETPCWDNGGNTYYHNCYFTGVCRWRAGMCSRYYDCILSGMCDWEAGTSSHFYSCDLVGICQWGAASRPNFNECYIKCICHWGPKTVPTFHRCDFNQVATPRNNGWRYS